jgi:sporulation protein YlmC with PRC-barrel domain
MRHDEIDLAYRLLDDDLVDCDGRRCGKVDDIELEGEAGSPAQLAAILVGPGAYVPRLARRLRGLGRSLAGDEMTRVEWDEVEDVDATVKLKRSAEELGLGEGDDRAKRLVDWIPGAS